MEIKFLQEYKNYKKGNVIKVGNITGKNLIKKGIAEKIVCFPIKELYVCQIGKYNSCKLYGFEFKSYGIFTYEGKFGLFDTFDLYSHIVTGSEFKKYDIYSMGMAGVCYNDMVVNRCKPFNEIFFQQMKENGWDLNYKLTLEEIKVIEDKLNVKNNNKEIFK